MAGSATGTIYADVQPLSLAAGTRVIFETGTGAVDQPRRLSLIQVANILTWSIYDATAVVCLANSKIWTIPNTNRIFICAQFDTTQATPANQTSLLIDNSSVGVTSPISTDCFGLSIGDDLPNLGARNNAASNFFTGNVFGIVVNNTADDATVKTQYFDWNGVQHA